MTTLEFVEGLRDGTIKPPPMIGLMPAKVHSCEEGKVELRASVNKNAYNDLGMAHGGWAMTLLDTAMALAAVSTLPLGKTCPSSDFSVRFIRPLSAETGEVRIIGSVLSRGRQIIVVEGRVESDEGRLHAFASGSYVMIDHPGFSRSPKADAGNRSAVVTSSPD